MHRSTQSKNWIKYSKKIVWHNLTIPVNEYAIMHRSTQFIDFSKSIYLQYPQKNRSTQINDSSK
jgi:hypothetical protein